MNNLIIDVPSLAAGDTIRSRLIVLAATAKISRPAPYYFCGRIQRECRVRVATEWTEKKLEDWLYSAEGVDYIGVCEQSV